jgi:preprotein translocase subunit SecE
MADKIKFALALVILAAGVAGFYLLSEQAMILRVLAVLAGFGAGNCCQLGKPSRVSAFLRLPTRRWSRPRKSSGRAARKPCRPRGVFAFVVVMAVFLYLTDKSLEWALYDLILGWKKS